MMRRFSKRASAVVALGLVLLPALSAMAQEEPSPAALAFDEGESRYDAGEFMLAAQAFHRAYELAAQNPRRALIVYNEARALEHAPGHECEAQARYEQFLHEADGSLPAVQERLRTVQDRLNELDARMEGQGSCDEQPVESGAAISPVGPILIGAGAAALIASAITGALALAAQGDLQAACGPDMICAESERGRVSDLQALAITTDVMLPVGAAIAIVGAILTAVLREGSTDAPSVAAWLGPNGAGALARWEL